MTFFPVFDVPVFWPILLCYWIVLFVLTMRRQIAHMIKFKYIPFNIGKQVRFVYFLLSVCIWLQLLEATLFMSLATVAVGVTFPGIDFWSLKSLPFIFGRGMVARNLLQVAVVPVGIEARRISLFEQNINLPEKIGFVKI